MDRVLQPLREPVRAERDEYNEASNFGVAAATCSSAASRIIVTGREFDVDGRKSYGEPGCESRTDEASNKADHVNMAVVVCDVDGGTQHERTEWYSGDPRDKREDKEDYKDQEHDASGIVFPVKHVDGSSQAPDDVQDARCPDELLGKGSGEEDVAIAEDDGDTETEDK